MKAKRYTYFVIEHRPRAEGGALEFNSTVPNLDTQPDLWEKESPFTIGQGRVVTQDEADEWNNV